MATGAAGSRHGNDSQNYSMEPKKEVGERESGEEDRPNKKQRKPHKLRTCKLCGQPQQKDFGHSQSQGEHFCALYSGKSVQLWLAEKRMGRK